MRFFNPEAGPSRLPAQPETPILPERIAVAELDEPKETKRRPIPKVAVYVSGSAFAITVGLTLLVLPYARQAAKLAKPPKETFHTNRYLIERRHPPSTPVPLHSARETPADTDSAQFNAQEETSLFGSSLPSEPTPAEGATESEGVSPLLGFQALGIATALVSSMAALGAWGVSWALGVKDMESFASAMRDGLASRMPALVESVNRPSGDRVVDEWVEGAAAALSEAGEDERPT